MPWARVGHGALGQGVGHGALGQGVGHGALGQGVGHGALGQGRARWEDGSARMREGHQKVPCSTGGWGRPRTRTRIMHHLRY